MPIVCSVATEAKRVALTFDDGPHPRYTERVLDTLAAERAVATFFIRGSAINPETSELVKRTVAYDHACRVSRGMAIEPLDFFDDRKELFRHWLLLDNLL